MYERYGKPDTSSFNFQSAVEEDECLFLSFFGRDYSAALNKFVASRERSRKRDTL